MSEPVSTGAETGIHAQGPAKVDTGASPATGASQEQSGTGRSEAPPAGSGEPPAGPEKTREQKRDELVKRLQDDRIRNLKTAMEASGEDPSTLDEAAQRAGVAKIVTEIQTETDVKTVVDKASLINLDLEGLELILPEGSEMAKEVPIEIKRRELKQIELYVTDPKLPEEIKRQIPEILKIIQNADGSHTEADIIDAVTKLNTPRNVTEILLRDLGKIDGEKLGELLDRIEERKKVGKELEDTAGNTTGELVSSTGKDKPDDPELQAGMEALQKDVTEIDEAKKQGKDVPEEEVALVEKKAKTLLDRIANASSGQIWTWIGIAAAIFLIGGTLASLNIHGKKGK